MLTVIDDAPGLDLSDLDLLVHLAHRNLVFVVATARDSSSRPAITTTTGGIALFAREYVASNVSSGALDVLAMVQPLPTSLLSVAELALLEDMGLITTEVGDHDTIRFAHPLFAEAATALQGSARWSC